MDEILHSNQFTKDELDFLQITAVKIWNARKIKDDSLALGFHSEIRRRFTEPQIFAAVAYIEVFIESCHLSLGKPQVIGYRLPDITSLDNES